MLPLVSIADTLPGLSVAAAAGVVAILLDDRVETPARYRPLELVEFPAPVRLVKRVNMRIPVEGIARNCIFECE